MTSLKEDAPLVGLKVIELGQIAAGPFAGMLLADLGADVVKVERPDGGDGMRGWPPLMENEDGEVFSGNFASLNRNKRSIAIDLKDPNQVADLKALCAQADVLIENYRPGVLRRLGLGYEDLKHINPRLVYCSISGYGQTGPYAGKGAFDVTVQAMSGLMSVTGEEKGLPVKCGVPVGDFVAGLYAAYTILAALSRVNRDGQGTYIDCSMLGGLLGISALQTSEYYGTGQPPRRLGTAHPRNAPYQGYEAKDRMFVIAAGNDKLWRSVCQVIGRPELADDERFATQVLRAKNQKELTAILQPIFATRTAEEWMAELERLGVPCAPVNDYHEILHDPHVQSMGIIGELHLPNGVATKYVGFPVLMNNYTFSVYRNPPKLGEHQEEVFREWLKKAEHS
ncbi:MAG: carnitine dehydratase [Bacillus thermozeamaize]|jgi:crotonobetainyl-CoA:carnitine CoA-transferase CaiB-like acyl-CoA transferase|uniref:Carnitine dehydratase n=1 Tax=Bacillus thermozeamaize TaxID=230954 RepID=A0A1Y3PHL8_9BACI|nr:MAG: carnitine dehydratase [Bacillus thermozeamaize]